MMCRLTLLFVAIVGFACAEAEIGGLVRAPDERLTSCLMGKRIDPGVASWTLQEQAEEACPHEYLAYDEWVFEKHGNIWDAVGQWGIFWSRYELAWAEQGSEDYPELILPAVPTRYPDAAPGASDPGPKGDPEAAH